MIEKRSTDTARRTHPANLWCILWISSLMPLDAAAQEESAPPEYFQRLIETANVRFKFYDPRREHHHHLGFATYQLDVSHRYSFRLNWIDLEQGGRQVTIRPKLKEVTYKLENEVRLPQSLETDRRWDDSLVHHEFDHVAMTVDPRPRMLVEHLYRQLGPLTRRLGRDVALDRAWVEAVMETALEPRRKAVLELLLANENLYDEVTRHGAVCLPDRSAFFRGLFMEKNLRRQEFPYLREVRDLIRQRRYREAELPYRLVE